MYIPEAVTIPKTLVPKVGRESLRTVAQLFKGEHSICEFISMDQWEQQFLQNLMTYCSTQARYLQLAVH